MVRFHNPTNEKEMIKKIAYSVVLGGMLAGLGACNADPVYENAVQDTNSCSISRNQFNTSMLPGSASFEVEVYRVGTQGEFTLPVSIQEIPNSGMTTEGVTCSNAVFANGSNKAVITISIANGVPPTVFGGNILIAKDNTSIGGYSSMSFRIPVEYEWEDIDGTGWMRLPNFIWFNDWVEVGNWQKAIGFERWRVIDPMRAIYAEYFPDAPTAGDCWGWGGWSYDVNDAGNFEFYNTESGDLNYDPFCLGMKFGGSSVGYYLPTNYKGSINGTEYDYSDGTLAGTYWEEPLYGICAGYPTGFPMSTDLIEFTMPGY